jgi:hypothetical protein
VDKFWQTIDIRPVPAGWRIVYLGDDPEPMWTVDMPGWVVEREAMVDAAGDLHSVEIPDIRVVAGAIQDGVIGPAVDTSNFWKVLTPSDSIPTNEEAVQERADRASQEAARMKARAAKAALK